VHKLLARQIAKATNEAGSIDLEKLFALVADAYADLDRDRRRTDRSMSLMIEEIDAVQRNLEHMVIERTGNCASARPNCRRRTCASRRLFPTCPRAW
jgi:hypothetical protein